MSDSHGTLTLMDTSSIALIIAISCVFTALTTVFAVSRLLGDKSGLTPDQIRQQVADATNEQLIRAQQILENSTEIRLTSNSEAISAQNLQTSQTIGALVAPLQESLKALDNKVADLEKNRATAYSKLDEQVVNTHGILTKLMTETTTLSGALRRSDTRGRWGELQLRRILEMLSMTEQVSFLEQKQEQGDGVGRPDVTVLLPGDRVLYIDSKTPMAAYLNALDETDLDKRNAHFASHARALKDHVSVLKKRDYTAGDKSLNYVIMFIPTESSLAAACEVNPNLIEDAARDRVILTSPTALIAVLSNISMLWQQDNQAKNSQEIAKEAGELHTRLSVFIGHFGKIGASLGKAVDHYNSAIASFDSRVMPTAQRVATLGRFDKELSPLSKIDVTTNESRKNSGLESVSDEEVS